MKRALLPIALLCVLAGHASTLAAAGFDEVGAIFKAHCVLCHAGDAAPLGLRLDSYDGVIAGSSRGKVAVAGDPAASELIRRVRGTSQPRMPMTGPPFLSDAQVATLENWIREGMPAAQTVDSAAAAATPPAPPGPGETVTYVHVAPIFAKRCVKCHAERGLMGPAPEGFRLDSHAQTLAHGDRARVVPGNPGASELLRRVKGQARPRMPFDGPPYLDTDEIALIERWIADGARDAAGTPSPVPTGARVRLHGTLERGWRLDGTPLQVGPGTRIKKKTGPGDYARVRGNIDAQGQVRATRIRRR